MWDRSFRWQRLARISVGGLALAALGVGAISFAQTPAASRAGAGIAEISRESSPDSNAQVTVSVPASLNVRRGGLVYRENPDGSGDIVGRVIKVEPASGDTQQITLLLTPAAS